MIDQLIWEYDIMSEDRYGCFWNIYWVMVTAQKEGYHRVLTSDFVVMCWLHILPVSSALSNMFGYWLGYFLES